MSMFEGTDLSMAYGGGGFDNYNSGSFPQPPQQPQQQPQQAQALPLPKSTAPHSMPPDPIYNPPPAMYAQQSATPPPSSGIVPPSDSFWDRIARKKWEVFKYFVMSLIVVLAFSIDHIVCHYMSNYISKSFFTETQEFLIRVSYPVAIILLIWILKASV